MLCLWGYQRRPKPHRNDAQRQENGKGRGQHADITDAQMPISADHGGGTGEFAGIQTVEERRCKQYKEDIERIMVLALL